MGLTVSISVLKCVRRVLHAALMLCKHIIDFLGVVGLLQKQKPTTAETGDCKAKIASLWCSFGKISNPKTKTVSLVNVYVDDWRLSNIDHHSARAQGS